MTDRMPHGGADLGTCAWCRSPVAATVICDHVIGWTAGIDSEGTSPRLVKREALTCDLPLCDEHTTQVGRFFLCGEHGTDIDTFDRCPLHAGVSDFWTGLLTERGMREARELLRRRAALSSGVIVGERDR